MIFLNLNKLTLSNSNISAADGASAPWLPKSSPHTLFRLNFGFIYFISAPQARSSRLPAVKSPSAAGKFSQSHLVASFQHSPPMDFPAPQARFSQNLGHFPGNSVFSQNLGQCSPGSQFPAKISAKFQPDSKTPKMSARKY